METEELIKLVDGIYKNILEKFNPGARQMINAGKAYLKALHGAAAASRLYVDAITKLARQAQQGTWGSSSDIGTALIKVVEIYKEIQDQQMNILKAFYVDLLVPLETNLEKDTKVVQSEQKKFLQQHKQRAETYSKAAALMKKQRKKSKGTSKTGLAMDKELKNMQVLEEEKTKLDSFCEQSLKNAMTQERRRYGFVLERQCSLAKHYLSYYSHGVSVYQENLEKWQEVAKTREYLPESVENIFSNKIKQVSIWQDDDLYSNPRSPNLEEDRISINSQLRKTKSMDASCLDIRSIQEAASPVTTLNRAKSDHNINAGNLMGKDGNSPSRRPKSLAVPNPSTAPQWETHLARAMYAYLSSGENQLSFLEGDIIALIGERTKGWQFGENLRTQCSGWFPMAYTELLEDSIISPKHKYDNNESYSGYNLSLTGQNSSNSYSTMGSNVGNGNLDNSTPRMFGDTLHIHRSSANAKQIRRAIASNNIPPPALPAPIPTPSLPYEKSLLVQSHSTTFNTRTNQDTAVYSQTGIKTSASSFNFASSHPSTYPTHPINIRLDKPTGISSLPSHLQGRGNKNSGPVGNISLHSSNDSGFSNDPPPQPEVDYSDEESIASQTKIPTVRKSKPRQNNDQNDKPRKMNPIRPSNSAGNLTQNRHSLSEDQLSLIKTENDKKGFVKRTKSFWRFGKGNENEVLEGMAMWKHKDLVEIEEKQLESTIKRNAFDKKKKASDKSVRKISRDRSNDSERTMQANDEQENQEQNSMRGQNEKVKKVEQRRPKSFNQTLQHTNNSAKKTIDRDNYDSHFNKKINQKGEEFYDDGDGLLLRTVNRKNILQQYSDSIGSDSESESEQTSDPYDCIIVDDQMKKVRKSKEKISNVAAIGKKLEKLSKSSKYPPSKQNNDENRKIMSDVEIRNRNNTIEKNKVEKYGRGERHSFRTFGRNKESDPRDINRTIDRKRNESDDENEVHEDRRKHFNDSNSKQYNRSNNDNRVRSSYESINSDFEEDDNKQRRRFRSDSENETSGDFTDRDPPSLSRQYSESGQYLPRSKLSKTNSNASNQVNEDENMLKYGESMKRRMKSLERNSRYDEKSPHSGNLYGPWYDLWGIDASTRNEKIHLQ